MNGIEFAWLIVSCIIISIILLIILGLFAVRGGSYLYRLSSEKLVFRRRRTERLFATIIGLLFAVGGPLEFWQKILVSSEGVGFAFMALLCIIGSVPLFWRAGPDELCLDLSKHTYCFVNGPPFFSKIYTGSWLDIAGVCVWPASQGYVVSLVWKNKSRNRPILGRFRYRSDANQFADETASTLKVPRIPVS